MSKIRVLHKAPVLNDLGVILSVVELAGPSSESKPTTGIANGSLFLETDTGKIFIFDEDDGWSETGSGGGGGGGGGSSSGIFVKAESYDTLYNIGTYNQIKAAAEGGSLVCIQGPDGYIYYLSSYEIRDDPAFVESPTGIVCEVRFDPAEKEDHIGFRATTYDADAQMGVYFTQS